MSFETTKVKLLTLFTVLVFIPQFINGAIFDYRNLQPIDNFSIALRFLILFFIIYIITVEQKYNLLQYLKTNYRFFSIIVISIFFYIFNFFILNNFSNISISFLIKDLLLGISDQLMLLGILIILVSESINKKTIKNIIAVFLFFSCLGITYNFLFKSSEFAKFLLPDVTSTLNLRAFYQNRNYFGFTLALSIILLTLESTKRIISKKVRFSLLLIHIVSLVLTMSRNSIMILIIYLLSSSILDKKISSLRGSKRNKLIILFTGCFTGIILLLNFNVLQEFLRLENIFSDRIDLWSETISIFKSSPFFGVGQFDLRYTLSSIFGRNVQPHNYILNGLASYGIILFTLITIEFFAFVRLNLKNNLDNKSKVISFCIAISFYAMFETVVFFGTGFVASLIMIFTIVVANDFKIE